MPREIIIALKSLAAAAACWLAAAAFVVAASESSDDAANETSPSKDARLESMKRMASRYHIFRGKEAVKLDRSRDPVLRWTNPVRGAKDGCLFLWLDAGHPQAIVSFYPSFGNPGDAWDHEFQSLSDDNLVAERNQVPIWTPEKPGVEFKPVPNSPPPADSAVKRASQIRTIAGRFSAAVIVREDKSALRLLTTPIYRYNDKKGDLVDGAVLVFAQGTDPELVLLLEARVTKEKPQWWYALGRMTTWGIEVAYEEKPVWKADLWDRANRHPNQTYLTLDALPSE